jgi:hypothetical protein
MHKKYSEENLKKVVDLFEYVPSNGHLLWKAHRTGVKRERAGCETTHGYRAVWFDGVQFPEHRIVWAICKGHWPKKAQIDHINEIKDDNRIENLREAFAHENAQNMSALRKKSEKAKSKYVGVTYQWGPNKSVMSKPWKVQMHHQRKLIYLGYYATELEAHQVYLEAKAKYHTFCPEPRDLEHV